MNVKGRIDYDLWTVRGTYLVHIDYNLEVSSDWNMVLVSSLQVSGDGDKPEELDDPQITAEIVSKCFMDARSKKTKRNKKDDLLEFKVAYGSWGAN